MTQTIARSGVGAVERGLAISQGREWRGREPPEPGNRRSLKADGGAGDRVWALRLPTGYGYAARGGFSGEPQAGGTAVATRRAEVADKAAEAKAAPLCSVELPYHIECRVDTLGAPTTLVEPVNASLKGTHPQRWSDDQMGCHGVVRRWPTTCGKHLRSISAAHLPRRGTPMLSSSVTSFSHHGDTERVTGEKRPKSA